MAARLVLASASPRRRELLQDAGYNFEVLGALIAECSSTHFSIRELTTANATRKARTVARARADAVVVAADTLVALDGAIMGKPSDYENARAILHRLNGRTHEVCTAVYICAAKQFASFTEISRVRFRSLTDSGIDFYLAKVNPLDKAGAYAAQNDGGEIIAAIEGSVTNVIGLPMERTAETLARFGIRPRRYVSTATSAGGAAAGAGSRRSTR